MRAAWAAALAVWAGAGVAQDGADIVILGEVHDNPAHHREQARIVVGLGPAALVWEMMEPGHPARMAGIDPADGAALAAALEWQARGWPDFAMYHPILLAAPGAAHLGAGLPRDQVMAAIERGAPAVWGAGADLWGLGPLDPADQAAREAEQAQAHCDALPPEMLPGMVAAQRLRDATLARAAAEAFDRHGGPVVVITGTGHARRDTGIPAVLARARPDLTVWSLGQVESDPGPGAPFDAVNVTDPAPRPDPCAAFR